MAPGGRQTLVSTSQHKGRTWKAGSWLALAAVLIQALIPNLVAVEITLAAEESLAVGFLHCPFGHVHGASGILASTHDEHPAGGAPPNRDRPDSGGLADSCSICIALHVGGQFTAPAEFRIPTPQARPHPLLEARLNGAHSRVALAAYNARAPPLLS